MTHASAPGGLDISLGTLPVGELWGGEGQTHFRFSPGDLDHPDRAVLGQWFEDRLSTKTRRTRGMHPWFENALPERDGALRRRLVRSLGLVDDDDLALLVALGDELPGNVRAARAGQSPSTAGVIVDEDEDELPQALRASLGGVQLKFALSGQLDRLSISVRDPADVRWILKVAGPAYPSLARNENAIMGWCRRAGFDVPETHVIPRQMFPTLGELADDVRDGFLIKRYDRADGLRIHQEDFAQVLGIRPAAKYGGTHALGLARRVGQILGDEGLDEYFRRLVLVVATGNADAHLKNWSLLYRDGITPAWSPLYDQVATVQYEDVSSRLALRIGNARFFRDVEMTHFAWMAESSGLDVDRIREVIEGTLVALRGAFDPEASGMQDVLAKRLRRHWSEVPLLSPYAL